MKPSTKHSNGNKSSPDLEEKETELEATENTLHKKLIDGTMEEPAMRNDIRETEESAAVPSMCSPHIVVMNNPPRNYSIDSDSAPPTIALSFADIGYNHSELSTV